MTVCSICCNAGCRGNAAVSAAASFDASAAAVPSAPPPPICALPRLAGAHTTIAPLRHHPPNRPLPPPPTAIMAPGFMRELLTKGETRPGPAGGGGRRGSATAVPTTAHPRRHPTLRRAPLNLVRRLLDGHSGRWQAFLGHSAGRARRVFAGNWGREGPMAATRRSVRGPWRRANPAPRPGRWAD